MALSINIDKLEISADKRNSFQNRVDRIRDRAIIGLEYIIENRIGTNFDPIFYCVLCDVSLEYAAAITHLSAYIHRLKYLKKHFPTPFKKICKLKRRNEKHISTKRISEEIENTYGRLTALVIENNEFSKDRMKYTEEVLHSKHFEENSERTFVEFITKKDACSPSLTSNSDNDEDDLNCEFCSGDTSSDSPTNSPKPEKVVSVPSSPIAGDKMTSLPISKDDATKWKPVTKEVPFLPVSPQPISTLIQTHTNKLETARMLMVAAKQEFTEKYKEYIRTPITHPDYFDQWTSFRSRRSKELSNKKKVNLNPSYAKSEWQVEWKTYLDKLLQKDLELKEIKIKKDEGIADEEVIGVENESQNLSEDIEMVDINMNKKKEPNPGSHKNELESQKLPSSSNQHQSPRIGSPCLINRPQSVINRPQFAINPPRPQINPFRSPIKRTPSPINRLRSPINRALSPLNRAISPLNRAIPPLNRAISPLNRDLSPINRTPSPYNRSRSPNRTQPRRNRYRSQMNRQRSPRNGHYSPRSRGRESPSSEQRSRRQSPSNQRQCGRRQSPRSRHLSPRSRYLSPRRSPSPRNRCLSPRRSSSPRNRRLSPRRSSSPRNRRLSPRRSSSPRNRPPSPKSRYTSPRNRSPLLRYRSPIPRNRSTSPRDRSTLPGNSSTSPRNRSPSPSQSPINHPQLPQSPQRSERHQDSTTHSRSMSKPTEIQKITTRPKLSKNFSSESEIDYSPIPPASYQEPIKSQGTKLDPNYSPKKHPAETEIPKKPSDLKMDEAITIMSVLRLLIVLEDILGSLGPNVIELMTKAITMDKAKTNHSNQLLDNEECYIVFEMIKEKLKGLLTADMVETSKIVTVQKTIKDMTTLVKEANDRRAAITAKISLAFTKQGVTNISQEQLQQYTDKYIKLANAKRNDVGNEQ